MNCSNTLIATLPPWLDLLLHYKTFVVLFLAASATTAIATPLYITLATRLGWVDHPGGRKQHHRVTATMGGLVIFATVFAGTFVTLRLNNMVGDMLREKRFYIIGLLACSACMLLLGVVDDRYALRPRVKLLVQFIVAIAAVSLGFRVEAVTLPWLNSVHLPAAMGIIFSLVWIIGITNAINLTDGLDGLAAGICFLAATVNAGVAIWLGNYYMSVMMLLLAGALLGFLKWNLHPARVFLGDTGALALGMYLALASLHSAQKAHTVVLILVPLFALGYPIFDTLLAVARRMVRGQPLFSSDRDHIHHRLLERSGSHSTATLQIYIASIILCGVCIAAMTANHLVVGLALAGVLALALFSARFLGYLEWGGWMARWSGREETRLLHSAAELARLRIAKAHSPNTVLRALASIAPESRMIMITLIIDGREFHWHEADSHAEATMHELAADQRFALACHLASEQQLGKEHRQLLEDLARLALIRLRHIIDDAPPLPPGPINRPPGARGEQWESP